MKTVTNNFAKFYTHLNQKNSLVGAEEDEDGAVEIFASAFVPAENGEDGELSPIETEAEWDLIEEVLNQIEDELGEEE